VSSGDQVFQALHEEQPALLKTLPEERVFKKSKLPGFPGFTGRSGSEKGQKSS
jgi:hypothetical protein